MKIVRESAVFVLVWYIISLATLLYSVQKSSMIKQYNSLLKMPLLKKTYERMGYEGYAKKWRFGAIAVLIAFSVVFVSYFIEYFLGK